MSGSEPYEEVTHLCMKLYNTSATRHRALVLGVINPLQQWMTDVCILPRHTVYMATCVCFIVHIVGDSAVNYMSQV